MDSIPEEIFLQHFPAETSFERAVFFSWYCGIADCAYCYMSTQPQEVIEKKKMARRTKESILAEFFLAKKLGWDIGFFSGGYDAFTHTEFEELLKLINAVIDEKIWVNIGPLTAQQMETFFPYISGVVGAIETVNPIIHDQVCPSKPIRPIEEMFIASKRFGLKRAITIILGLGETIEEFPNLARLIAGYDIHKIHFYGLNPHPGTIFEHVKPPSSAYQAEWIAKTRVRFPHIDIQCGIWVDRVSRVSELLAAGANSLSKFPAFRYFGRKEARMIEEGAKQARRAFRGTLTVYPAIDVEKEVTALRIPSSIKPKVKAQVERYLNTMRKNAHS